MSITQKNLLDAIFNLNLLYYSKTDNYHLDNKRDLPFFFDINSLNSFAYYRTMFLELFAKKIKTIVTSKKYGTNIYIAASGHSGIPFASLLAEKLSLPMIYIRESSKKHGKKNMIEGTIPENSNALIFTDMLSSESKVENTVTALTEKNVNIKGILTIINLVTPVNSNGKLDKYPVFSLIDTNDFVKYVSLSNYIPPVIRSEIVSALTNVSGKKKLSAIGSISAAQMQKNAEAAAETLLDIKAVTLSVNEPYRYASGILSPIYCDNRLLISNPLSWDKIINWMSGIIESKIGIENIEVIAGTSTAGIPHAARIAEKLKLPMIYVKSESGETGKKSFIEGTLPYGKNVLVIEDLVSTGKSSIQAVKILKEHGAVVKNCVAIFTYQMKAAEEAFAKESCKLYTVSTFGALIKKAVRKKYISENDSEKAVSWNNDPENWGKKYGFE